jgi:hypothetical protein
VEEKRGVPRSQTKTRVRESGKVRRIASTRSRTKTRVREAGKVRRPKEKKTAEYRVSFASAHPAGAVAGGSPGAFRGVPRPRSPPSVFPGPAAKPRGLGSTLRPRGRGPGGRSGSTLRYCSGPTGLRNPGAASCRRAEENSGGIVPPAAFRILTPAVEYHRGFWIRCPRPP